MHPSEPKIQGHIRAVSLPPIQTVLLSTFNFSRLKSMQKKPALKKSAFVPQGLSSHLPTSVQSELALLLFRHRNPFMPLKTEIIPTTQSSCNSPSLYFPGLISNSLKPDPCMPFSKKQSIKRALKKTSKTRFFSQPRQSCEVSLQTSDIELLSTS